MDKITETYESMGKIVDISTAISMLVCVIGAVGVGFRAGMLYTIGEMTKEKENNKNEK